MKMKTTRISDPIFQISSASSPLLSLKEAKQKLNPKLYKQEVKARHVSLTVDMLF